jgi:glutathione S-transferase
MKLYDCATAPSPRRARIFLAEKGLEVVKVPVDLRGGEHLTDAFRSINPRCTVPVLELDDGTRIAENDGIAAFLEAAFPNPPLLGRTPAEKGEVGMWNARVVLEGFLPLQHALRHQTPGLKGRAYTGPTSYEQIPALAAQGLARAREFLHSLDERLSGRAFVATNAFTMVDITAFVCVEFASWVKLMPASLSNVGRWHLSIAQRATARA